MTAVLRASRPRSQQPARDIRASLDPVRILGYSSAIAINTIAAALLVMPLQPPPPAVAPESPPVWILPATPVAPEPPPVVRQVPEPTTAPTVSPPVRTPAPVADVPVVVERGAAPVDLPLQGPATADATPGPALHGPVSAGPAPAQLQYAVAPAPPYPRESIRNGDEGLVVLEVLVDVDGRPLRVEVAEGSGHRALDQAARRHVLAHWRFRPAMHDGRAVRALGLVPIEFALD